MPDGDESDPSYRNESIFLRRIHPEWVVADYETQTWQTSSQAYQPHPVSKMMSMTYCDVFPTKEDAVIAVLGGLQGYGVVEVTYAELHASELIIHLAPEPDDPGHVLVEGTQKKSKQRALSRVARWVINPREGEPLPPHASL